MHPRSSLFRSAVLVLFSALAACNGSTTATGGLSPANPLDSEESAAILQINAIRMMASVPQVTVCFSLNVSASAHSDDMRDNNYLAEVSPADGSTVRTRACKAGYTPSCSGNIPMAELVAEGSGTGAETVAQWATDTTAGPILVQKDLVLAGIGRSIGVDNERWTLDLASVSDPSCN
jgi:uncharacterized protein YkwD